MGNVDYGNGSDFVLEPCRNFEGCYVWKEEDIKNMVDRDHQEDEVISFDMPENQITMNSEHSEQERESKEAFIERGKNDNTTVVEFSIKFYYTIEFAEATDYIDLYFDQVVAETNQGYINSNIPIRATIFCIEATSLHDDVTNTGELFSKFENYKGTVEALRGSADAAALVYLEGDACGMGWTDSWYNHNSIQGRTITAQQKDCALAGYTMGHELGHNFGTTHDRKNAGSNPYYPFGHGSHFKSGYRTIMAYSEPGFRKRVNVYSSPQASYEGVITGTDTEDSARVIKENRFGFAAVGDESGICGTGQVNGGWSAWGPWSPWSSCSSRTGSIQRTRQCDNPPLTNGVSECSGSSTETRTDRGIRLCGGNHKSYGNVFYNGQPVCDDQWDDNDAKVVCNMMGFQTGHAYSSSKYGDVATNFIFDDVRCTETRTVCFTVHTRPIMTVVVMRVLALHVEIHRILWQ